jgi:flavin reductase (DIM6/NTAB) family NADH-FMN oxidoreductase RutF
LKPLDRTLETHRPPRGRARASRGANGVPRVNGNAAAPALAIVEPIVTVTPTVSPEDFRAALRHFPSGVTIVTLRVGEEVHGLTVSAFASISPTPPLVMVAIDHRHHAHDMLEADGVVFGVNILHQGQRELSDRFAWIKDEDRFAVGQWTSAVTGAPILADAAAWLDCSIHSRMPAGSHTIFVGEVQAAGVPLADRPPLIYWSRGYRALDLAPKAPGPE